MGFDDPPARVGVVLELLCDPSGPTLFEADPREHQLQWMLDRLRARYGARALLWGECSDPRGRYTGAKIAYQSFPDMERLRWLGIVVLLSELQFVLILASGSPPSSSGAQTCWIGRS